MWLYICNLKLELWVMGINCTQKLESTVDNLVKRWKQWHGSDTVSQKT